MRQQPPLREHFRRGNAGPDHFVIYYRDGRVPQPGIAILGNVTGNVSIFDRLGPITVRVEAVNP